MRRSLAGHAQPFSLGGANRMERTRGRDMLHMQMRLNAGLRNLAHHRNIPLDDGRLSLHRIAAQPQPKRHRTGIHDGAVREPGILRMLAHRQAQSACPQQCGMHHRRIEDRLAVIGEAQRAGLRKRLEIRLLRALAAQRRSRHREQPHLRSALGIEHPAHRLNRIVYRHRIRHGDDRGKTRRPRPQPYPSQWSPCKSVRARADAHAHRSIRERQCTPPHPLCRQPQLRGTLRADRPPQPFHRGSTGRARRPRRSPDRPVFPRKSIRYSSGYTLHKLELNRLQIHAKRANQQRRAH